MAEGFVHTVYAEGRWQTAIEGDLMPLPGSFLTKVEAVRAGRDEARRRETEHVIDNEDGSIGERNSYAPPHPELADRWGHSTANPRCQDLARDGRIRRPVRGLAAFGVLPIPGPFDEAALIVVGCLLWLFWRQSLREAWQRAGDPAFGDGAAGEA